MRKFRDTAKAFALKLIWRLFTQPSSLWVSWVNHYFLKYNSFWDVRDESKGSSIWRKLLKLRDLAYKFLRVDIKDGKTCHFWFDDWLGKGRLINVTGPAGITYLGVMRHAKVCDAVAGNEWNIRGGRSRRFHELYDSILALAPPAPDKGKYIIMWKHGDDDYRQPFSAARTWDQLRIKKSKVEWCRVVWFAQGVPCFSFITWLAIRNRQSTGDRMRAWGIVQGCVLCGERDETRDHLFFACPYSYTIWEPLARPLIGRNINPDWQWTVNRLQRMGGKSLDAILAKMLFQTVVYHIWRERNARRHQQSWKSTDQLSRLIDKAVRNRISSLRYKPQHKLEGLLTRWFEVTL